MKSRHVFALLIAGIALAGCIEKAAPGPPLPTEPMGAAAPEFGSTEALSSIAGFIEGRWSPVNDIEDAHAKRFGLDALEMEEVDASQFWQFDSDGTFYYGKTGESSTVEGTWKVDGQGVRLTYVSFEGRPISVSHDEIAREAERSAAGAIASEIAHDWKLDSLVPYDFLYLADDRRRMSFRFPFSGQAPMMSLMLERLGIPKE